MVVSLALIVMSATVLGWEYRRNSQRAADEAGEAAASPAQFAVDDADAGRRCDGRTRCSQMTSCAQATWFLQHCPGVKMDGNGDGVPCQQQWCGE